MTPVEFVLAPPLRPVYCPGPVKDTRVFCGQDLPNSGSLAGNVQAPPVQSSVASVPPKIVPGAKVGASKTAESRIFLMLDCGHLSPVGVSPGERVQTCLFAAQLPFAPLRGMHTVVAKGVPFTNAGQSAGVICRFETKGVAFGLASMVLDALE